MSKAVMLSVRPKWCEKIARGEKTIEVRKTRPKLETPFKCYIYCTQGNDARRLRGSWGKVIGEFTCDRIFPINVFDNGSIQNWLFEHMKRSCLTYEELTTSATGKPATAGTSPTCASTTRRANRASLPVYAIRGSAQRHVTSSARRRAGAMWRRCDGTAVGLLRVLRKAHRNGRKVLRLAKRRERMHRLLC